MFVHQWVIKLLQEQHIINSKYMFLPVLMMIINFPAYHPPDRTRSWEMKLIHLCNNTPFLTPVPKLLNLVPLHLSLFPSTLSLSLNNIHRSEATTELLWIDNYNYTKFLSKIIFSRVKSITSRLPEIRSAIDTTVNIVGLVCNFYKS